MARKTKISKQEYDLVLDQSAVASDILEGERFKFIREYFKVALDYIESSILNNTIKAVDERVTITESIVRIFKTPKKTQVDEMVGQYKFIKKFLTDLQSYKNLKEELEAQIAEDKVIVDDKRV